MQVQKQNRALESRVSAQEHRATHLSEEVDTASQDRDRLAAQLTGIEGSRDEMARGLQAALAEKAKLQRKIADKDTEIQEYALREESVSAKQMKRDAIFQENERQSQLLAQALNRKDAEISKLRAHIRACMLDVEAEIRAAHFVVEFCASELEGFYMQSMMLQRTTREEHQELKLRVECALEAGWALFHAATGLTVEHGDQTHCASMQSLISLLPGGCQTIVGLRSDNLRLQADLSELKRQGQRSEDQWNIHCELLRAQLEEENAQLRQQRADKTISKQELDEAVQERCEQMTRQMMVLENDKRMLTGQLEDAHSLVQQVQDDAEAHQKLLEGELHDVRTELVSMRQVWHARETEHAGTISKQKASVMQAHAMQDRAKRMETELAEKSGEADRMRSELDTATHAVTRGEEELARTREMLSETHVTADQIALACEALKQQLEEEQSSKSAVQQALQAAVLECNTFKELASDLERRLQDSARQVKLLEAKEASLVRQVGDGARRIEELETDNQQQHFAVERRVFQVHESVRSLEAVVDSRRHEVIVMLAGLQGLEKELCASTCDAKDLALQLLRAAETLTNERQASEKAAMEHRQRLSAAVFAAHRMQSAVIYGFEVGTEAEIIQLEHILAHVSETCEAALSLRRQKSTLEESLDMLKKDRAEASALWESNLEELRDQLEKEISSLREERDTLEKCIESGNAKMHQLNTQLTEEREGRRCERMANQKRSEEDRLKLQSALQASKKLAVRSVLPQNLLCICKHVLACFSPNLLLYLRVLSTVNPPYNSGVSRVLAGSGGSRKSDARGVAAANVSNFDAAACLHKPHLGRGTGAGRGN